MLRAAFYAWVFLCAVGAWYSLPRVAREFVVDFIIGGLIAIVLYFIFREEPMHRSEFTITATGIVIGGHYVPPAAPVTAEAERVQSVLLGEPRRSGVGMAAALTLAIVVILAVGVLA